MDQAPLFLLLYFQLGYLSSKILLVKDVLIVLIDRVRSRTILEKALSRDTRLI